MEKLKIGIIGCGGMSGSHAQGLLQIKDSAEITAVCDIIPERAEKAAKILDVPYITTDYKTMVDKVDAVLVILPHDLHYECGVFFARNKKHILMEKPLCNTEEECLRLIKVAEEEGVTLMTAYPVRFWPGIVKLKEIVDSHEYGDVFQMSIWTEQHTQAAETEWCNTARLGGGQFFSHGCHYIDLLLWFLGEPVKGIHIGSTKATPWLLREGTSNATILFKSGAMGYHFGTWGAMGTKMGYDFQVLCEKATIDFCWATGEINVYREAAGEYKTVWKEDKEKSKNTQFETLHFIDCVKNKKKPLTDPYISLQGLRVIWRMYDAEKHNQIADLTGLGFESR